VQERTAGAMDVGEHAEHALLEFAMQLGSAYLLSTAQLILTALLTQAFVEAVNATQLPSNAIFLTILPQPAGRQPENAIQ